MSSLFTLRSANRIANLTCERVDACYHDITASQEVFDDFLASLDYCTKHLFAEDERLRKRMIRIKNRLREHGLPQPSQPHPEDERDPVDYHGHDPDIIENLEKLARIFSRLPVKAILLPQVHGGEAGYADDFISAPEVVDQLVARDPAKPALILQPRERPTINRVTIFDAFPYFEVALRQIDRWPAVLIWDHKTGSCAFVPVSNKRELDHVFALTREPERMIERLNAYARKRIPPSHYYIHLSDLHLGIRKAAQHQDAMEELIEGQLETLNPDDTVDFVVTGDFVNSPNDDSIKAVRGFHEYLSKKSHDEPIYVLGNHDINRFGLALRRKHQIWAHIDGDYPKIKIVDDIGVIFMIFNSNAGGVLAQGEIGRTQMDEMREMLLDIKDLGRYTPIAVLHHHVAAASYYTGMYGNEQWQANIGKYKGREKFKRLRDADEFLEFLRQYDTRFILHGHKHSPLVLDVDGIYVIACGSTTGRNKDYVSYNMLKFCEGILTCSQFVEQLPDAKVAKNDIMAVAIDY
jgi:predicted phosphodiesterase